MFAQGTNPDTLTLAETAEIVEKSEANTFGTLIGNLPPGLATEYGFSCQEVGGATAIILEKLPVSDFNRVIGLGVHQPATEATIDELLALYGRSHTPFGISVSPLAQPARLSGWLLERGFHRSFNWAKMIRGTEPPPQIETDLRIEVVNEFSATYYAHVTRAGSGIPPWMIPMFEHIATLPYVHSYLAYAGDVPVAVGSLFVDNGHGTLFNAVTLPEYRRRGAQGAIMSRRIQDGIALGVHWFTTETNEDTPKAPNTSYRNMLRTGFQLAYLRPNYEYEPQTAVLGP